jgi:hypothetical protein
VYSQQELDDAVAAGVLTPAAADAFRAHVEKQRSSVIADEEQFRLLTGFNDIFVSIATVILLFAVGWIGQSIGSSLGLTIEGDGPSLLAPLGVAATAWGLALFFTAKRRMALPSILLLLAFVGGILLTVAFGTTSLIGAERLDLNPALGGLVAAVSGIVAAAAAWVHWRTFRVPITVAAGTAAAAGMVAGVIMAIFGERLENAQDLILSIVLLLGIGVFLFAMWWDSSDRARLTRRSDVAFWLHLLAAPMIIHPVFTLLGLNDGNATILEGFVVILLYVVIGLTALAIDRRALLVSALAYVLYALTELFKQFGAVELNVALTALVIGSALLMLSAFWHQARRAVVVRLPEALRDKLPMIDRPAVAQPA